MRVHLASRCGRHDARRREPGDCDDDANAVHQDVTHWWLTMPDSYARACTKSTRAAHACVPFSPRVTQRQHAIPRSALRMSVRARQLDFYVPFSFTPAILIVEVTSQIIPGARRVPIRIFGTWLGHPLPAGEQQNCLFCLSKVMGRGSPPHLPSHQTLRLPGRTRI
jgi:hypothetical protein